MRDFKDPYYSGPCKCASCEALREEGRQEMKQFWWKYIFYGLDYVEYMLSGGKDIYKDERKRK